MTPQDGAHLRALLPGATPESEREILEFAREAPLLYGFWRHLKGLYKTAETEAGPELLGALIGRLDAANSHIPVASDAASILYFQQVVAVAVEPPIACVTNWQGLTIADLSEPNSPQFSLRVNLGACKRLTTADRRAYVEVEGPRGTADQIKIIDLTDPRRPIQLGSVEVRALRGIGIMGHILVVVEAAGPNRGRMRTFDVSDPVNPSRLAVMELPDAGGLALAGNRAYVNWQRGGNSPRGLRVFDLSDPAQPVKLGTFHLDTGGILVGGTYLENTRQGKRLCIVDTSAPIEAGAPVAEPPPPARTGLLQRLTDLFSGPRSSVRTSPGPRLPHSIVDLAEPVALISDTAMHQGHVYLGMGSGTIEVIATEGPQGTKRIGSFPAINSPLLAIGDGQLHVFGRNGAPITLDLSDPAHPSRVGFPPSPETLHYMKRRARRLLRTLGIQDPQRFVETAYHSLRQAGTGHPTLDPQEHWVSIDLLYGASGRYLQARHGRGGYRCTHSRTFRKIREERFPEAWNNRLDLVRELYITTDLPWQTHETMWKILRANKSELPCLKVETLKQFLNSPSPLLRHEAVRSLAPEMIAGTRLDAEPAAWTFYFAPGKVRSQLAPLLMARAGSPNWARPFAATLTGLIAQNSAGEKISQRNMDAAALLSRGFAPFVPGDVLLPVVESLIATGRNELVNLALSAFRAASPGTLPQWLALWLRLPEAVGSPAWEALVSAVRKSGISLESAEQLVNWPTSELREATWRLLLDVSPEPKFIAALWEQLLKSTFATPQLRTAIGSSAALDLLRRSEGDLERLADRLISLPDLASLLTPAAIESFARVMPVRALYSLIGGSLEAGWEELRDAILRGLLGAERLTEFWKAAPNALVDPAVQRRLFQDPILARSFMAVSDPSVVEIVDAPFEPLLHDWLNTHTSLFARDSRHLVTAATHPLPAVRDWGLKRVRELGLDLTLALRLLESEVPPSVALGRDFFLTTPNGHPAELNHLLALMDSPDRATRGFARELLERRLPNLNWGELVPALAEHGDAEMNRFLAELLRRNEPSIDAGEPVRAFERGVLRAPNRGRRAKEQIKLRHEGTPMTDVPLLLELARGGSPRDAEWALTQLARLAAAGEIPEGVRLEGVVGI